MFDPGFFELVLILIIALLVVGPERLPGLVKTVGRYLGKARAMFENVRSEVNKEIAAEELKKSLEAQAQSSGLYDIVEETKSDMNEVKDSVNAVGEELNEQAAPSSAESTSSDDSHVSKP